MSPKNVTKRHQLRLAHTNVDCHSWLLFWRVTGQVASTATLSHILDATGTKRHHQGNKKLSDSQTNAQIWHTATPTNQHVRQLIQPTHARKYARQGNHSSGLNRTHQNQTYTYYTQALAAWESKARAWHTLLGIQIPMLWLQTHIGRTVFKRPVQKSKWHPNSYVTFLLSCVFTRA